MEKDFVMEMYVILIVWVIIGKKEDVNLNANLVVNVSIVGKLLTLVVKNVDLEIMNLLLISNQCGAMKIVKVV